MKELYLRWKWGFPIGYGFRLKPKSREHYTLYKDEMGFEVFLAFHQDNIVEIYDSNKPEVYFTHPDVKLSDEVWSAGLTALSEFLSKSGKRPMSRR